MKINILMKKRTILILLIIALLACSYILGSFGLNLTLRTILATVIAALFCTIRAIVGYSDDKVDDESNPGKSP